MLLNKTSKPLQTLVSGPKELRLYVKTPLPRKVVVHVGLIDSFCNLDSLPEPGMFANRSNSVLDLFHDPP